MASSLFVFISPDRFQWLKQGFLLFDGWDELNDVFLENRVLPTVEMNDEPLSDDEFAQALRPHYDNMAEHLKGMVTWEYYLAQALNNRTQLEAQIKVPPKSDVPELPNKADYQGLCCLRLFESISVDALWQQLGGAHRGLAVALDRQHDFFTHKQYASAPQQCAAITYDDARPAGRSPQQPFPAWLRRAEHYAYEKEWRLVRLRKVADRQVDRLAAFKIPNGLIRGLYLGINVDQDTVRQLRQLVKQDLNFRHIPAWRMAVSEEYLRLVPVPLKTDHAG